MRIGARSAAVVLAVLLAVLAAPFAGQAAADTSSGCYEPTVSRQSDGTMRLACGGHTYYCYRGDACMWRGRYETYYACQTVVGGYTGWGWVVNNQTGGAKITFYGKNGTVFTNPAYPDPDYMQVWNFGYMSKFRTC